MTKTYLALTTTLLIIIPSTAQQAQPSAPTAITILKPARIWDGEATHENQAMHVKDEHIDAASPESTVAAPNSRTIDLPRTTLTPGLVEKHSHILLHAYNKTSWTDQISREGLALRVTRATNHLRTTLMTKFTTVKNLNTEGAQYANIELKQTMNQNIIPDPRILTSTKAIVTTGNYQPKFITEQNVPQKAEEADNIDSLTRMMRNQIDKGTDWIKMYANYR